MPAPPLRRLAPLLGLLALAVARPAAASSTAQHVKGGGKGYIPITAVNATVMHASGGHGVLTVETGLDVPDPALHARTLLCLPRLRDAYARFLVIYANAIQPGAAPDPQFVGAQLQRATDKVLGKPGARVLLGSLILN